MSSMDKEVFDACFLPIKKKKFLMFSMAHFTHSEVALFLSKANIEEQLPKMNEFPYS
jgi:hypothetical protein